jgi:prolyl-tRNA synthetase
MRSETVRASQYFLPTLREVPADAELISHRLLVRGGFVRKTAAGVYSYLPMGKRVHDKIANIVRDEINAIGGIEVFMPVMVPRELLEETGRDSVDVLFPLKDRGERPFVLGFTHEEVVTDIVRSYVNSWKQLPLILYQVQTKFRDEPRPRGGLIRAREFTMKDAYSFDHDEAGLDRAFVAQREAYGKIFVRCGVDYLVVDADSGAIGGSESSEFMVLAESGEDTVLRCDTCGYAANAERAGIPVGSRESRVESREAVSKVVPTPGAHTVAQVCEFLKMGQEQIIKTIIVRAGNDVVAALVRGDRELNLPKLGRFLGTPADLADATTVVRVSGAPVGFAGPVGLKDVRIVADYELQGTSDMVVGANEADAHRTGVTPGVDFQATDWADIRTAIAGDRCDRPGCAGHYSTAHGIEVGHIFKLGTKYSKDMKAQVQTETGENIDILMGCYGLGISRTMAAIIEAHHDDDGIIWPANVAPFEVVLVLVNPKDEQQRAAADKLYEELQSRDVEVIYDDRDERSGVKFKDADLIGYPVKVVVGRALAEGNVEIGPRRDKSATETVPVGEAAQYVVDLLARERGGPS